MALCFVVNPDGTVTPTAEAPAQCSGYVALSAAEYQQVGVFAEVFTPPTTEQAAQVFVAAFGLVLVCNVAAYLVGAVVKSVSTERD